MQRYGWANMCKHRHESEKFFNEDIFQDSSLLAEKLEVEVKMPRIYKRETHRANMNSQNVEDYYRKSVYIPYLDSLIMFLKTRFEDDNSAVFYFYALHPQFIKDNERAHYKKMVGNISTIQGDSAVFSIY